MGIENPALVSAPEARVRPNPDQEALAAGAGSMDRKDEDVLWQQERIGSLLFHMQVENFDGNKQSKVTLSVYDGSFKKNIGRHTFFIDTTDLPSWCRNRFYSETTSPEELQKDFGIAVEAERFYKQGVLAEWRYRLKREGTDEIYIGTIAAEDHWQGSHSHNFHTELYSLVRGTLVLVTQDAENPDWVEVKTVSSEDGLHCSWVHFIYDTKSRSVVGSVFTFETLIGDPPHETFLQTELQKAHNVYLGKGAVIGTVKKQASPVPEGEQAWSPETNFDDQLNAEESQRDSQPTHASILDEIYRNLP